MAAKKFQQGFTIVELIVILGALSMIGVFGLFVYICIHLIARV